VREDIRVSARRGWDPCRSRVILRPIVALTSKYAGIRVPNRFSGGEETKSREMVEIPEGTVTNKGVSADTQIPAGHGGFQSRVRSRISKDVRPILQQYSGPAGCDDERNMKSGDNG